jgi:site-specific recombinase XerD
MQIRYEIDNFLKKQASSGKKENTLKNYKTDLICFLNYLFDIQNHDDISHFQLSHILEYGSYLNKRFKSDNSRRRRVQTLRIFFDFLLESELVTENFVRKIPVAPKFVDIPKPTPLRDIHTIWRHYLNIQKEDKQGLEYLVQTRNQLLFLLIFTGGLKVAEISTLKMKHIISGSNPRVLLFPKKGDPYSIPLHKTFNTLFVTYKKQLEILQKKDEFFFSEVFFYANPYKIISGGLSPRGIELIFKELRVKLDISLLTPKSLRMACIYSWIHQRHSEETIKTWLGVAPSYSLMRYEKNKNNHLYNLDFL